MYSAPYLGSDAFPFSQVGPGGGIYGAHIYQYLVSGRLTKFQQILRGYDFFPIAQTIDRFREQAPQTPGCWGRKKLLGPHSLKDFFGQKRALLKFCCQRQPSLGGACLSGTLSSPSFFVSIHITSLEFHLQVLWRGSSFTIGRTSDYRSPKKVSQNRKKS